MRTASRSTSASSASSLASFWTTRQCLGLIMTDQRLDGIGNRDLGEAAHFGDQPAQLANFGIKSFDGMFSHWAHS